MSHKPGKYLETILLIARIIVLLAMYLMRRGRGGM